MTLEKLSSNFNDEHRGKATHVPFRRRSRFGTAGLAVAIVTASCWFVFGPMSWLGVLAVPLGVIGLVLCLFGIVSTPRLRNLVGIVLLLITGAFAYTEVGRLSAGHFRPSEYPMLAEAIRPSIPFFPAALPETARDIHIEASGVYGLLPAPDRHIEVRFVLPIPEAQQLLKQTASSAIASGTTINHDEFRGTLQLLNPGDANGNPPPRNPNFECFILFTPGGMNGGGVCIDPTTGAVLYWYSET